MRGETTATMVSDEIVHSFMKPLSQRVKLDRRLWTYADKRRQAVLDSHMEASVFKTEITAKKESKRDQKKQNQKTDEELSKDIAKRKKKKSSKCGRK